jgi:hypothetical protein
MAKSFDNTAAGQVRRFGAGSEKNAAALFLAGKGARRDTAGPVW